MRYFLVNKRWESEYKKFLLKYDKVQMSAYLSLVRYCKELNGEVVNAAYGERFGEKARDHIDTLKMELLQQTHYPIGFTGTDGFYLNDLSPLGLESVSGLIGFLKANKGAYYIIDERGYRLNLREFKNLLLAKGVYPHWKSTINPKNEQLIERAIANLKSVLKDLSKDVESADAAFIRSEKYQASKEYCRKLTNIVNSLEEI